MELTVASANLPEGPAQPAYDGEFVALWLGTMISSHTRRAYAADIRRLFTLVAKSLAHASHTLDSLPTERATGPIPSNSATS